MGKKVFEESHIQSIANAIRLKLGVNDEYLTSEMADAISQIHGEPVLEELVANENGVYNPSIGKDGFSDVTVSVPPTEPDLEELSITQNGTYTPSEGKDGFSEVIVNVPSSGGGNIPMYNDVLYGAKISGEKNIELTNYSFNTYDNFEFIYKKTQSNNGNWPQFFKVIGEYGQYYAQENRWSGRQVINVGYGTRSGYNNIYTGDGNISVGSNIDNMVNPQSICLKCTDDRLYFSYGIYASISNEHDIYLGYIDPTIVQDRSVSTVSLDNGLDGGTCYLFPTNNGNYFRNIIFYDFIVRRNNEIIHEYIPFDNDGTLALKDLITNDIIETEIELVSSDYINDNIYYSSYYSEREPVFIEKTVTQNGTYNANNDNADGYNQIIVNVPSGGTNILFGEYPPDISITGYETYVQFHYIININVVFCVTGGYNGNAQIDIYFDDTLIFSTSTVPNDLYNMHYVVEHYTASYKNKSYDILIDPPINRNTLEQSRLIITVTALDEEETPNVSDTIYAMNGSSPTANTSYGYGSYTSTQTLPISGFENLKQIDNIFINDNGYWKTINDIV